MLISSTLLIWGGGDSYSTFESFLSAFKSCLSLSCEYELIAVEISTLE
jgi:hypothetical protein